VPVYDRREAGRFWLHVQTIQDVEHVNRNSFNLYSVCLWKLLGPIAIIDIAPDCGYRRNFLKLNENCWATNIPGMDYVLRSLQRSQGFRSKQAVRIGDDTDSHNSVATSRKAAQE